MASLNKDQRVLVIGGCGYFGSRVVRWLIHEEHIPALQLAVIDNTKPSPARLFPEVNYIEADITHRSKVANLITTLKPNIIIHTASPPYYLGSLEKFMLNNVEGTRNLLDAAVAEPSVHIFIYTSSSSVVHDYVSDLVEADENYPLLFLPQQRQPYHHSKAVAEQLALSYNRKRPDFVVAAIRPSAMFGPGESIMIPSMVRRAKRGTLRYQIGSGENLADFTYVDNTVYGLFLTIQALFQALERKPGDEGADTAVVSGNETRVEGEAFAITNDVHANFWDFARQVGAAAGYPVDRDRIVVIPKIIGLTVASMIEWMVWVFTLGMKTAPVRRMDLNYSTITRTFDISKAKKRLGYRPRWSLEESIELAVQSFVKDEKDVKKNI